MDVSYDFDESLNLLDVPVVATALLPESVWLILLAGRQESEPIRVVPPKVLCSTPRHRLLDRTQDMRDGVGFPSGMDHHMHMVRHEHIGPEVKITRPFGGNKGIR